MEKNNSRLFLLCFLGMLTAFGPFVTDMYLPTLPDMTNSFMTTSSMVQLGLTTSMIGLAVGQLLFGPLSDKYGRRSPLIVAMVLFLLSTLGCIFSKTILQFAFWRFVQGMSGAGGIVISRSVAADKFTGKDLAKTLALIGAINGVAPVTAPIIGGVLAETTGWKGIFWILFVLGVVLLLASICFSETYPKRNRQNMNWFELLRTFRLVIRNRSYVCYVLQFGFAQGVLFANIASAPFIMQQHYGFSPMMFSICFGINALVIVLSSASAVRFSHPENALYSGSRGMFFVAVFLFLALILDCSFWVYEIFLVGLLFMLGLTFTASNTLALDCERDNSGTASALLGALGFAFGGLVSPIVGLGNMLVSTGFVFLVGSGGAYVCARLTLNRPFLLARYYKKS